MPSRNFSSKMCRQHSGRISFESENWAPTGPRLRSELAAEPTPPSAIANAVDHEISKGKKQNIKGADGGARRGGDRATNGCDLRDERVVDCVWMSVRRTCGVWWGVVGCGGVWWSVVGFGGCAC